jgi:hypothetical protein
MDNNTKVLTRQARRDLVAQHNLDINPNYKPAKDDDDLDPANQAHLEVQQQIDDNAWLDDNIQLVQSTVEKLKLSQKSSSVTTWN